MTVCIAVCLEDGAFLMADGKEVLPFMGNAPVSEESVKVHKVSDRIVCTQFGMSLPAPVALASLRRNLLDTSNNAADILTEFERVSMLAITPILLRLTISSEQASMLRFGFLFGGLLANDQPYFGWYLWQGGGKPNRGIEMVPGKFTAIGGDDEETNGMFKRKIQNIIKGSLPTVAECIDAGEYTIRNVQRTHSQVGGKILFSVIRKGCPIRWGNR